MVAGSVLNRKKGNRLSGEGDVKVLIPEQMSDVFFHYDI